MKEHLKPGLGPAGQRALKQWLEFELKRLDEEKRKVLQHYERVMREHTR